MADMETNSSGLYLKKIYTGILCAYIQRELYNLDGHLVANWTARTCGGTWWSCDCMFPKTGVKCPRWKPPSLKTLS